MEEEVLRMINFNVPKTKHDHMAFIFNKHLGKCIFSCIQ